MKELLVAIPFIITGCCAQPVYEKPKVISPTKPNLIEISPKEFSCLSKDTYSKFVKRELQLREYSEKCMVILKEVTVNE